jgi:hypothetical protein
MEAGSVVVFSGQAYHAITRLRCHGFVVQLIDDDHSSGR